MDLMTTVLLVAGLVLLIAGAELLVRGASALAVAVGISPLVVGLTVVAYGTSAPELAVGVSSSLQGRADLALGNVVGSNICNVLLILGVAALFGSLVVAQRLVRREVPLFIGLAVLTLVMAADGAIGRIDGLILVAGAVGYTAWAVISSRREEAEVTTEYEEEIRAHDPSAAERPRWVNVAFLVGGLGALVLGSQWLVDGAVELASALGLSELVIGLTVVAIGTSLPEVATSVIATVRGERDIAVGNAIGSCLLNILAVLGVSAVTASGGVEAARSTLFVDIPVMIACAIACLPVFFTGYAIDRWEGFLFLGAYAAYLGYVVLDATDHDAVDTFSLVVVGLGGPLVVATLAVVTWRELGLKRDAPRPGPAG